MKPNRAIEFSDQFGLFEHTISLFDICKAFDGFQSFSYA